MLHRYSFLFPYERFDLSNDSGARILFPAKRKAETRRESKADKNWTTVAGTFRCGLRFLIDEEDTSV